MMQTLFGWLGGAVDGSPAVALMAAMLWGVISVVLSPCHLASIPLIVGFIHGQGEMSRRRAAALASLFAAGILVTIAVLGAMTAAAGQLLGDIGPAGSYIVAAVLLGAGLHLTNVLPIPMPAAKAPGFARKGYLAAALLGLLFGLALGPCTFAFMAAILGVVFRTAGAHPVYAGALLLLYGVGHCGAIAAAGTSASMVQRYLNWSEGTRAAGVVRTVCGVLTISGGLWLIYTA